MKPRIRDTAKVDEKDGVTNYLIEKHRKKTK